MLPERSINVALIRSITVNETFAFLTLSAILTSTFINIRPGKAKAAVVTTPATNPPRTLNQEFIAIFMLS